MLPTAVLVEVQGGFWLAGLRVRRRGRTLLAGPQEVGWIDESIEELLLHVHVVCRRYSSTAARSYGKPYRLRMNGRSKRQKKVELFKAAG